MPNIRAMPTVLTDSQIIDNLGGTAEVARMCQVTMPSVSNWKTKGIPNARRMYLRKVRPAAFRPNGK